MSDNYQAVYDAVRSRFSYCDAASAIGDAARNGLDASHAIYMVQNEFMVAASEMQRPSVIYRPTLELEAGLWVARYHQVEGEGKTPDAAMRAFDQNWVSV